MIERIKGAFARHAQSYTQEAQAQRQVAQKLAQMMHRHVPAHPRILEAGHGTGFLTRHLINLAPKEIWLNDLIPPPPDQDWPSQTHVMTGDISYLPLPSRLDLICSASMLQWITDPGDLLARFCNALSQQGILAVSSFGPQNFHELIAFGLDQGAPSYLDAAGLAAALPHDMKVLHSLDAKIQLRFSSARHLFAHLRATGVNGYRGGRLTIPALKGLMHQMNTCASLTLTYRPSYCIAQKAS